MRTKHTCSVSIHWTGNNGTGTSGYRDYERSHAISGQGKPGIAASSDAAFAAIVRGGIQKNCWWPRYRRAISLPTCISAPWRES